MPTLPLSKKLEQIADSRPFNFFIVGCIVVTSAAIGMETYPWIKERWGPVLDLLDKIILGIFVVEQLIRFAAEGRRPWRYFLNPWNVFDFIIISICLLPLNQSSVAIVRLVRILRVLRLFRTLPRLRIIINGMIKSVGSIGYIGVLLSMHFYIFSVLGVHFFHDADPKHFADLPSTLLTLFTVLTLETWPDIMAPSQTLFPSGAPVYFVSFIIIGTMIFLNLLVGVVVGNMTDATQEAEKDIQRTILKGPVGKHPETSYQEKVKAHIDKIDREIQDLKNILNEPAGTGG